MKSPLMVLSTARARANNDLFVIGFKSYFSMREKPTGSRTEFNFSTKSSDKSVSPFNAK